MTTSFTPSLSLSLSSPSPSPSPLPSPSLPLSEPSPGCSGALPSSLPGPPSSERGGEGGGGLVDVKSYATEVNKQVSIYANAYSAFPFRRRHFLDHLAPLHVQCNEEDALAMLAAAVNTSSSLYKSLVTPLKSVGRGRGSYRPPYDTRGRRQTHHQRGGGGQGGREGETLPPRATLTHTVTTMDDDAKPLRRTSSKIELDLPEHCDEFTVILGKHSSPRTRAQARPRTRARPHDSPSHAPARIQDNAVARIDSPTPNAMLGDDDIAVPVTLPDQKKMTILVNHKDTAYQLRHRVRELMLERHPHCKHEEFPLENFVLKTALGWTINLADHIESIITDKETRIVVSYEPVVYDPNTI